jgi:hypothetical protein
MDELVTPLPPFLAAITAVLWLIASVPEAVLLLPRVSRFVP